MPYRDNQARPENGLMTGPTRYCKPAGVGAAFISRSARNYAKLGSLDSL